EDVRMRSNEGPHPQRRLLLLPGRGRGGRHGVTQGRRTIMRMMAWTAALALSVAGCGMPPNQTMLTRTSSYMKAMSFGNATGYPLDIAELERRFPELKGIVVSAAQWVEEYDKLRKEADERGAPMYDYRIPYGANITIEVTGEPVLTRTYTVPPTGFVH